LVRNVSRYKDVKEYKSGAEQTYRKPTQRVAGSFGERHPLFDASLLNGMNEVL